MNVLLINPNRFLSPPVPPIGLEYVAGCLEVEGHRVKIIDLCFSEEIFDDLDKAVRSFDPDIAGITIRNVDSVLYSGHEFYLPGIKDIVRHLKSSYGLRVCIGGAGLQADPQGVLEYLDADYAFAGSAEDGLNDFLVRSTNSFPAEKIYFGHASPAFECPRRSSFIDYGKYYQAGGIAGFETHKGCSSSCVYCLEASSRVAFRRPEDIVREIRGFIDAGYNHLHLCDPEFNEDLDFSLAFCTVLKTSGMGLRWTLYMKPANYNRKLFQLMKATGVYLITLTVDSFNKCSMYWSDVEKVIFQARSNGINLAVDFLAGFPYEKESVLVECLDLFRRVQPDVVNINTWIRLYRPLKVTQLIMKDRKLHPHLLGAVDDLSMIQPVFYNHIGEERLQELIAGDTLFRIAGKSKGVNYSTVSERAMRDR